ncbi:MAG: hypothetical protein IKC24_03470, partial [Oscillospiraceae bacterium]|nr:hypothetical protein [Oscillospiraceae bacterium]
METAEAPPVADEARLFRGSGTIGGHEMSGNRHAATVDKAPLTGGANIDNSTEVMKSLQRTFGGANDSARTQYDRTLKSKMGYGRNWGNPRSTVGNAIESGVAGTVADWLNAAGTALKSDRRSGLAVDSGDVEAKATGKEWYNRAGNYLQKEADWARMLSENAYLRGSRNLNNAQKLLFDAGIAGTQMASDVALGTLTGGSATIPLAIRSFGGGAQQARQAGATENQQIAYGTASALKEALTEKMFDGLAGVYGKGTADDFVDALARSFAKSDGGQALVRGLVNMGGEGAEEIASGFIDPALQGIYNGKTLGENYRELNMADLLHEGAVGMLLGNLGGSVDIARTMSGNPRSNLSYTDVLNEMNLSTPNNYAMNRAGNIAVGGKTDYTENNKTEAQNYAKVYLRDSDKRFGGAYSGGQVSAVEESAGRAARGQATLRPADSEAASLTFGKAVSAASLGIDGGSEQATLHLLRGDETLCTARAKRIASDRGLQLVLFAGDNLRITQANGTTASVRGYISGNRVFVRADHPRYTSEQIMLHEAGHNMIAMGEIDLNEVRDYIGENHSVGKTAQLYMDA